MLYENANEETNCPICNQYIQFLVGCQDLISFNIFLLLIPLSNLWLRNDEMYILIHYVSINHHKFIDAD